MSDACKRCNGGGIDPMFGYDCGACAGTGSGSLPKFRAECECGAKQPRLATAYTVEKWMRRHMQQAHRFDPDGEGS